MLRDLVKIANRLDFLGLTAEADIIDSEIKRFASDGDSSEGAGSEETEEKKRERILSKDNLEKLLAMDPYERWVHLAKNNRDEGEVVLKMSSKDEELSGEVKTLLKKLRNTFRDERNRMISIFTERWNKAQRAQDLASSLTPEQINLSAFRVLSPYDKVMTFFKANESDKETIINSMSRKEAVSFLEDCIIPNLDEIKSDLAEGSFPFNLKIKFMKKLLFSEYSKDQEKIKEEKSLIKKFYNLLPEEAQASLRAVTKGGTVGVIGSPKFSYEEYEPSEGYTAEEYHHEYKESKDPSEGYIEIGTRYRRDPSLLGDGTQTKPRGKIPTDQLPNPPMPMTEKQREMELRRKRKQEESEEEEEDLSNLVVESVKDIMDDDFYIFQMLPRPEDQLSGAKYRWVLVSALDESESEESLNEYADILEERYSERAESLGEKINEEEKEGECIIVDGVLAKEMLSSGSARLSNKKFPGSIKLKGPEDMIGRGEKSSSRLDPEKQEKGSEFFSSEESAVSGRRHLGYK